MRNPRLTYDNLENLLIKEYAHEGTTVEAMRSLMNLIRKYSPEKEEMALCQTVVKGEEIMPIMLTSWANKMVKISKGGVVGKIVPIRSIIIDQ